MKRLSDAAIDKALERWRYEGESPYMARVKDFTDEEIAAGKLRETEQAAERSNRKTMRESIEAALAADSN